MGKFGFETSKRFVSIETWFMRVKDADFEFDNFFFNSVTRMPFLGKFGPKTQKGFVLNETWSIVVFEDADSKFDNCCHKFHPQNNFLV